MKIEAVIRTLRGRRNTLSDEAKVWDKDGDPVKQVVAESFRLRAIVVNDLILVCKELQDLEQRGKPHADD